jgi:hypothetical protein
MSELAHFNETKDEGLFRQEYHYTDKSVTIRYKDHHGKSHREKGPAIKIIKDSKTHEEWMYHGLHHRIGGPAVIYENGDEEWYIFGKKHRDNGPAVIYNKGTIKKWFRHGKKHRKGGPAVVTQARKEWWVNNKLHRDDGPAAIYINQTQKWDKTIEYRKYGKLHRDDGPAYITGDRKEWYRYGKKHRDDGPAVIFDNTKLVHLQDYHQNEPTKYKEWWINDEMHRENEPAIVYELATELDMRILNINDKLTEKNMWIKEYFYKYQCHNLRGPAIITAFKKMYYINDREYSKVYYYTIIRLVKKFVNNIKKKLIKKLSDKYYKVGINRDIAGIIASYNVYR